MKRNNKKQLISYYSNKSYVTEQFKAIRAQIEFASFEKDFQVVLITSPEPESGKTTIAANLATVFAKQGKKTLLIDADMRRPAVHRIFNMTNRHGLSELIVTKTADAHDFYRETMVESLFVMTSGLMPPNPNELLSSNRMKSILQDLAAEFDRIIIDTPPVLAASDALVLAPSLDGVLLVLRSGHTLYENAKKVVSELKQARVPLIGAILNDVKEIKKFEY
ncbi:CpsD/CapB family tyrosine-protein kinase [Listeria sp. PSOL-1]|uniref:CpsD/CapB family tyrosine-protein kinase n=1 Tax=Listeria sp. PSOL-1 TaxID=1844999 RepID=UPI0013D0EB80|nr:CpsD/CapB family tyrosine-protein kinase [Listeria sp. PSOL-1]